MTDVPQETALHWREVPSRSNGKVYVVVLALTALVPFRLSCWFCIFTPEQARLSALRWVGFWGLPALYSNQTLNQCYAATEREQTRLNVTLFVNVLGVFW